MMSWIIFIFALISTLICLVELGVLAWLHITPTGYNVMRNAVSDYGVGPSKGLFALYLWLANASTFALAIALIEAQPFLPERSAILLFLLLIARIGLLIFPTDLEGIALTRTGYLHYFFAIFLFGFIYAIMSQLTPFFGVQSSWESVNATLSILLTITTLSLIAIIITMWKPFRKIFGLFERVFIVATTLWFLIVAIFLTVVFR